ncbi:hypothetical protein cypCar_00010765, partial [Cyprinus carpio]
KGDDILWKFGAEKSPIAKVKKKKQILSTHNVPDERFRDRVKLDSQTGSLTITNITTEHTGLYELEISGEKLLSKTFNVSVYGDDILWKYGAEKSFIAKMKKKKQIFSTFNGTNGRFRDRLKLDDQTGSLTITDITPEHAGLYEVMIRGAKESSKIFSVSVYARLSVPVIRQKHLHNCSSSIIIYHHITSKKLFIGVSV